MEDAALDSALRRLLEVGGWLVLEPEGRLDARVEAEAWSDEDRLTTGPGKTAAEPVRYGRLFRYERVVKDGEVLRFSGERVYYDWHAQEREPVGATRKAVPLYLAFANLVRNKGEVAERLRATPERPDPSWVQMDPDELVRLAERWGPLGLRAYHLGQCGVVEAPVGRIVGASGRVVVSGRSAFVVVRGETPGPSVFVLRRREDAEAWIRQRLRRLLEALVAEPLDDWRYALLLVTALLELRRAGDRQRWVALLNQELQALRVGLRQPDLLVVDDNGKPARLTPAVWLQPRSLYHAIFVSFLHHATGEAPGEFVYVKRCANPDCDRWFTTTRRSARFCRYNLDRRGNSLCKNRVAGRETYREDRAPRERVKQAVAATAWWDDPARMRQVAEALRELSGDRYPLPGAVREAFVAYAQSLGDDRLAQKVAAAGRYGDLSAAVANRLA